MAEVGWVWSSGKRIDLVSFHYNAPKNLGKNSAPYYSRWTSCSFYANCVYSGVQNLWDEHILLGKKENNVRSAKFYSN